MNYELLEYRDLRLYIPEKIYLKTYVKKDYLNQCIKKALSVIQDPGKTMLLIVTIDTDIILNMTFQKDGDDYYFTDSTRG
jgi:hypothetical protein